MKRIMYRAILAGFLALSIGATAHAGKIVSYNPSYLKPIKVLAEWLKGWNTKTYVYSYDPCLVVTVTEYAFGIQVNQTVTRFPCN